MTFNFKYDFSNFIDINAVKTLQPKLDSMGNNKELKSFDILMDSLLKLDNTDLKVIATYDADSLPAPRGHTLREILKKLLKIFDPDLNNSEYNKRLTMFLNNINNNPTEEIKGNFILIQKILEFALLNTKEAMHSNEYKQHLIQEAADREAAERLRKEAEAREAAETERLRKEAEAKETAAFNFKYDFSNFININGVKTSQPELDSMGNNKELKSFDILMDSLLKLDNTDLKVIANYNADLLPAPRWHTLHKILKKLLKIFHPDLNNSEYNKPITMFLNDINNPKNFEQFVDLNEKGEKTLGQRVTNKPTEEIKGSFIIIQKILEFALLNTKESMYSNEYKQHLIQEAADREAAERLRQYDFTKIDPAFNKDKLYSLYSTMCNVVDQAEEFSGVHFSRSLCKKDSHLFKQPVQADCLIDQPNKKVKTTI